jgi:tetratricopeptide (TPR) repeat protein
MTPELWARLNPLFIAAADKPRDERNAFIAEACGDDEELRRELAALVKAHEQQGATTDEVVANIQNLIGRVQAKFSPSDIVLGRFRIVRQLGSGGMGDVYEALDMELGQTVALKSIRPDIAGDHGVVSRFKKEVQLARRLGGPNICRIHELFVIPAGGGTSAGAFLTMEFLDGVTLADKVQQEGPIPWRGAQAIATDICAGLSAMHEAGIVHRDLKSRNIMLADRGGSRRAVLMDFGLAREVSVSPSTADTALTAPGTFIGTPEYMAPEQFEGKEVSPATDIYAMGVVLYEMLTGRHPFAAPNALRAAVLRSKRPDPASSIQKGVPHRWDLVIGRCLEYDPKRRYQSAAELTGALRNPFPALTKIPRRASELSRKQVASLALGIVLAGLALFWWYKSTSYEAPDPRAQKWYDEGTAALREGAYLQATSELQEAVKLDKKFGLAHARLAEAWADLDFTGTATSEMLLATVPEQERNLPDLDRRYIEAVRSTLTHDFPGAAREFLAILNALRADQKGYGYVDLGRALEKAGNIQDALKSYETAAKLTPDNPAPFVHLGILKGRLQDPAGSEAAYDRAEALYGLKHNLEGLGEVAFQRGHSANERGDSVQAKASLDKCMQIAKQISSVQLQVRALTQLSNVEYNSDQDDQSIDDADEAIQLAQRNGLEYWVADGLIRKGNAYLDKGRPEDLVNAEKVSQEALKLAEDHQHAHLEANAEFTLASLRDQTGNLEEEILYAKAALHYFADFGFLGQAADSANLIVRAEKGKGDLEQALQAATELLDFARKSDSIIRIEMGEESMGGVLLNLQDYPKALAHFEESLKLSKSTNEAVPYQTLHCADTLWRLGRYAESKAMLGSISATAKTRSDISFGISRIRTEMAMSRRRFDEAMSIADSVLRGSPNSTDQLHLAFREDLMVAEAELGRIREAQADGQKAIALAQKGGNDQLVAETNLAQARADLRMSLPELTKQMAESANLYFSQKHESESEWVSLFYIAQASKSLGDKNLSALKAKEAIDKLRDIEQNWTSPVFAQYRSRPDIQTALKQLSELTTH